MIAIKTQGLKKLYGRVKALNGVDLEVEHGEIFGFLGPNGAGKTTAIRCMLDLIRPNAGKIEVLGVNPQENPVAVRAAVGYLPGELHLEEGMTGEGLLRYLNRLRGGHATWDHVEAVCARLDFDLKTKIKNLSKGNKQKLGVIQALMHRPPVLLLDEPTGGLDPLVQQDVLKLLKEARAGGATVFFSSHNLSEVQAICDRVAIIRKGLVVEVAETEKLIHRALHRARILFKEMVDFSPLGRIPGVTILAQNTNYVTVQVEGEMDGLLKALAAFPVRDFETERPSLEEIFLTYYSGD